MTWKANAYLGTPLLVLFALRNIIPAEDDLACVPATAFMALCLVTAVSMRVTVMRGARSARRRVNDISA